LTGDSITQAHTTLKRVAPDILISELNKINENEINEEKIMRAKTFTKKAD